jgi:predicted phage terminase large subunit-like protein
VAWVNGRWLARPERQELIDAYREVLQNMARRINELSPSELQEFARLDKELERLERIHECEVNLYRFTWEYFSEPGNPGNSGNWQGFDLPDYKMAPWFHKEICEIMDNVSNKERNAKVCVAAPRGHGKSSFLSKSFPLREILYRKRKYVMIFSETPTTAKLNMEWLSLQMKYNQKLREDFGPLLSPKQAENPKDNSEEFVAWIPDDELGKKLIAKVDSVSTGQRIRGRNWNGVRPDLIILDDLESRDNTNTPELREKLRNWFSQDMMPLGDPGGKYTAYVYMGTTVHHDGLLVHVLKNRKDFKKKVYRAIIEWPERMDLWEECERIYNDPNAEDDEALENARKFYEENREEMERGAKVIWPEVKGLFELFKFKWDEGSLAFNTELQNNPISKEDMIFDPERFTYWSDDEPDKTFPRSQFDIYMGIDFAMGKERGDYSAIVTVARHRASKTVYVIDAWGDRVHPDTFLKIIVDKVLKYEPDRIAAEAQAAQEFFTFKLKEALRREGYPSATRVIEVKHRQRKQLRIEAMLPDIEAGRIRFSRNHGLLLWQFETYPNDHDDLPDSLAMAWEIAKKAPRAVKKKPIWL